MVWLIISPPEFGSEEGQIVGAITAADIREAEQRAKQLWPARTITVRPEDSKPSKNLPRADRALH
jgi:hypothetical protein